MAGFGGHKVSGLGKGFASAQATIPHNAMTEIAKDSWMGCKLIKYETSIRSS